MDKCCDHDHGAGGQGGHSHGGPQGAPPQKIQLTPEQMEFVKKLELQRKELTQIAQFISNKGLKFKSALFNEQQFDYYRGDNFHEIVLHNNTEILKQFKEVKAIQSLDKIEDSIKLGQVFIDYKLLIPFERDPRQESEAKKKYPKFIVPARSGDFSRFNEKGFYSWNIPKPRGKLALFLFIGFIIAIAFMLFSLWPMWLKIGIWYCSFYLLIFLMGFIMLRLVVWLFLFHFGVDFWILPNFFIDSNDIMDSFRPLLSFERRQDDMKMVLMRIGSAIALVFFVIQLAKEPDNLDGLRSFADDSMTDLFNWGNDKFVLGRQIADHSGNSTIKRKKTPQEIFMEAILDEEEEKPKEEPKKEEELVTKESETEEDQETLDRDALGGDDEEDAQKEGL